jgi:hypothetical protein
MNTYNSARTLLVGFFLCILVVGSVNSTTLMEAARMQTWDIQNLETLKTLFPDKASVQAFLYQLDPDIALTKMTVGEYELCDLTNDGKIELLATLDSSGRGFYNTLYVVHNVNGVLRTFKMGDHPSIELKASIVDLHHNGLKEILIPRLLDIPEFGTDPAPIVNDVYTWDGIRYSKVNSAFKDYYRNLLPHLKSEHEAIVKGRKLDVPSQGPLLKEKYEKEIEEINRILNE